jgi:DNA-binding NarL/FixJ family response regulator
MADHAPIRILLADDHEIVRKGIRDFLSEEKDLQVIAEAADGEQALHLMEELHPDVAALDIQMPKLTGIQVAEKSRLTCPDVRVLILTAYDYDPYVFAALRSGANGYILKTARSHELAQAVRTVYHGGSALDPQVTRKVVEHIHSGSPYSRGEGMIEHPSEREMEVLRLVVLGLSNRDIADRMGISHRTVQGHLANLFGKMAVNSRTEAALLAIKLGWISLYEMA